MTVCDAMTTIAEFNMAIEYNDRNNDDDDNDCNNNNNNNKLLYSLQGVIKFFYGKKNPHKKFSSPLTCGFAVQLAVVPIYHLEEAGSNLVKA